MFQFLTATIYELTWWQIILCAVYFIYFVYRSYQVWEETNYYGIRKGYKNVFVGERVKYLKLYHLFRMIFDIPPAIIGLLFPLTKVVLNVNLFKYKVRDEEKAKEELQMKVDLLKKQLNENDLYLDGYVVKRK